MEMSTQRSIALSMNTAETTFFRVYDFYADVGHAQPTHWSRGSSGVLRVEGLTG